jgi:hypothetical protein
LTRLRNAEIVSHKKVFKGEGVAGNAEKILPRSIKMKILTRAINCGKINRLFKSLETNELSILYREVVLSAKYFFIICNKT